MIAKLRGIVDAIDEDSAVIDVGGVGYLVFCSGRTLGRLPKPGVETALEIETHVREDHIHLYGFADAIERDWFRLLMTVQGVGARVALAILTALSPDDVADTVLAQDRQMLTRAPGVGPKLAARIVAELKDKVDGLKVVRGIDFGAAAGPKAAGPADDAISALVNLGYRRAEAYGAISHALRELGSEAPIEALVKAGLKELNA